jgi:uncharacterized membrane protein YdfJ with MMPL/SSD domain
MQALMLDLAGFVERHRRWIMIGWLGLVVAAVPFAARQSDHLVSGGYVVPGSESAQVATAVQRHFPHLSQSNLAVLLWPQANANAASMNASIGAVERSIRGVADVSLTSEARTLAYFAAGLVGPILVPLDVAGNEDRAQDIATVLRRRLAAGTSNRYRVVSYLLGEGALWAGLEDTYKRQVAHAEAVGVPVLLIVLLAIFGSLAAASLPVLLGAVAVTVTGALIYFLSLAMQMSIFVTNTASMLGIGVAVDYSLILLARVRQELAHGCDPAVARQRAMSTSGLAVVFSGVAVIASLMGLWVIPNGTIRSMALGAVVVVAVAVLATVTLLPALISALAARRLQTSAVLARAWAGRSRARAADDRATGWARWTRLVCRRPLASIVVAGGLLVALAIPATHMRLGTGALQQLDAHDPTRVGFERAAHLAGVGALGPIDVVLAASTRSSRALLASQTSRLRGVALGFAHVRELGETYYSGDYALFTVIPAVDPESGAAETLVGELRRASLALLGGSGVAAQVGGTSASQLDAVHQIVAGLWKIIAVVLIAAFIVIMIMLRSLLLPLKAVVMNLLSVGAAYGVLVITFQYGWFDRLFHYRSPGRIDALTPPLVLAIVFGLSMDYEIFLLTRIKERWQATRDSSRAVSEGLAASAQTISSAAFILVCVFAIFIGAGGPAIKEMGLGASVAIGLDATLIRLVLVPATMEVLGDWNWWLPQPLARVLQRFGDARTRVGDTG